MTKKDRAAIVVRELKKLYPHAKSALNYSNHWELLVAVILSARCTDKKVNEVTETLFKKYRSLGEYLRVQLHEFENDIKQIGLYKAKAARILQTATIIANTYSGKLPKTVEQLQALPGVGRKTANVVQAAAHGIAEGIGVDTHVMRLSRKFGLSSAKSPDTIEKDLMQIIPKGEWVHFTNRMTFYGREHSPAHRKTLDDPISLELKKSL